MLKKKEIAFYEYFLTLFITCAAITAYCFPDLSRVLIYDRQAVLDGEIWRIATAPFVHFSASHIFWDVLVFAIAGFAINKSGFSRFWVVCTVSAFVPGLLYLMAFPNLEYYGGLSGLATGAAAYFCLCSLLKTRGNSFLWVTILVFMGIKILFEAVSGEPLFVQSESSSFHVLYSAHIIGYLGALVTVMWSWLNENDYKKSPSPACRGVASAKTGWEGLSEGG